MPSEHKEKVSPTESTEEKSGSVSKTGLSDGGRHAMRGEDEPSENLGSNGIESSVESKPAESEKLVRPVNELGELYPHVIDPRTGEDIPFPEGKLETVDRDQRVPWGTAQRDQFISEWEKRGLSEPEGGWSKHDIHHIQPREYGGTNDFDNLVPVLRKTHQTVINPWWASYKPD